MVGVGAPSLERRLLCLQIARGVEHEADADVEAAGAVGVGNVVAVAAVGAEHSVEERESGLFGGALLAFGPFVMRALAGADVDGCARRDVRTPRGKRETMRHLVRSWALWALRAIVRAGGEQARTVCFVAPFRDVVQAAALVDLDAAIARLVRSMIAAFARVAAADGSGRDEERGEEGEEGEAIQRGGCKHGI